MASADLLWSARVTGALVKQYMWHAVRTHTLPVLARVCLAVLLSFALSTFPVVCSVISAPVWVCGYFTLADLYQHPPNARLQVLGVLQTLVSECVFGALFTVYMVLMLWEMGSGRRRLDLMPTIAYYCAGVRRLAEVTAMVCGIEASFKTVGPQLKATCSAGEQPLSVAVQGPDSFECGDSSDDDSCSVDTEVGCVSTLQSDPERDVCVQDLDDDTSSDFTQETSSDCDTDGTREDVYTDCDTDDD